MMAVQTEQVAVEADGVVLSADLAYFDDAKGLVVVAHGDASVRDSLRNRFLVQALHDAGFATLLADLQSPAEKRQAAAGSSTSASLETMSRRVHSLRGWLRGCKAARGLAVGYLGSDAAACAVLRAATPVASGVKAVAAVSPQLDGPTLDELAHLYAPTLLVVSGSDSLGLQLTRAAAAALRGVHRVAIVPDATRRFDERGSLDRVASHACRWFQRHLSGHVHRPPIAEEANVE